MNLAKIVGNSTKGRGVKVRSILASQFLKAPRIKSPDSVTFLEEDRICAYFGGGALYATPARSEPLL
jgi:photosynthetic reaction center H subunit